MHPSSRCSAQLLPAVAAGRRPGLSGRRSAAAALAAALALMACAPAAPARAEPRTVATLRAAAPLAGGGGFLGADLEREQASGSSWLVGVGLQPSGIYGGLRRYTRRSGDRPFYGAGVGLKIEPDGQALPAMWAEAGYELRLDPQVRALAALGLGLVSTRAGRTEARLLLGLGLGLTL